MFTSDKIRHLLGILQVNSVDVHADGKGADRSLALFRGDGTYQGGVQAAAQQKANLGIGNQPLFHAGNELFPDVPAYRLQIIGAYLGDMAHITVADKLAVGIIVAGREGENLLHQFHKILRLTGKHDGTGAVIAIVQRPDADGVSGGDELLLFSVIKDAGKFRVQHTEHLHTVALIHGQQHLAVAVTDEGIVIGQFRFDFLKAVDFTVAHNKASVSFKRLHSLRVQTHNGQAVESQNTLTHIHDTGIIGASGAGACEAGPKCRRIQWLCAIANDRTHRIFLLKPDYGRADILLSLKPVYASVLIPSSGVTAVLTIFFCLTGVECLLIQRIQIHVGILELSGIIQHHGVLLLRGFRGMHTNSPFKT